MGNTIQSLGLDHLAAADRLTLADELWDSVVAANPSLPVTPAQAAELDRRLADHAANPEDSRSWAQVHAYLQERHSR